MIVSIFTDASFNIKHKRATFCYLILTNHGHILHSGRFYGDEGVFSIEEAEIVTIKKAIISLSVYFPCHDIEKIIFYCDSQPVLNYMQTKSNIANHFILNCKNYIFREMCKIFNDREINYKLIHVSSNHKGNNYERNLAICDKYAKKTLRMWNQENVKSNNNLKIKLYEKNKKR